MFTSTIKGEIREFHVLVEQWRQRKIYRKANLNLLLFCRSRWRRRCGCVASVIVTIKHRRRFLFMYTFLGHVNTNPDTLKLNTWYLRLLEFGVVYPVWNHAPPPPVSVVHTNSTNPSDPKKIHSGERFQKYAVSVCGFTDFLRTEGWRIRIKEHAVSKISGLVWKGPLSGIIKVFWKEIMKCPHHLVQDLVLATALTSCNKLPSNDLSGPEALRTAHRIGLENNR